MLDIWGPPKLVSHLASNLESSMKIVLIVSSCLLKQTKGKTLADAQVFYEILQFFPSWKSKLRYATFLCEIVKMDDLNMKSKLQYVTTLS